jgi:hypothetical protein
LYRRVTSAKLHHYTIYYANHPDGTAHAESKVIIKSILKHYEKELYITNKMQGRLEALSPPTITPAVYSPPRHSVSAEEYDHFLSQLGTHYLVAGDWNAKPTAWGTRLTTVKGKTSDKPYNKIISVTSQLASSLIGPLILTRFPD